MKIDLYMDVFPGQAMFTATSNPFAKPESAKRYKITVNIPDSALTGVIDGCLPVEEALEVDKEMSNGSF